MGLTEGDMVHSNLLMMGWLPCCPDFVIWLSSNGADERVWDELHTAVAATHTARGADGLVPI